MLCCHPNLTIISTPPWIYVLSCRYKTKVDLAQIWNQAKESSSVMLCCDCKWMMMQSVTLTASTSPLNIYYPVDKKQKKTFLWIIWSWILNFYNFRFVRRRQAWVNLRRRRRRGKRNPLELRSLRKNFLLFAVFVAINNYSADHTPIATEF